MSSARLRTMYLQLTTLAGCTTPPGTTRQPFTRLHTLRTLTHSTLFRRCRGRQRNATRSASARRTLTRPVEWPLIVPEDYLPITSQSALGSLVHATTGTILLPSTCRASNSLVRTVLHTYSTAQHSTDDLNT